MTTYTYSDSDMTIRMDVTFGSWITTIHSILASATDFRSTVTNVVGGDTLWQDLMFALADILPGREAEEHDYILGCIGIQPDED